MRFGGFYAKRNRPAQPPAGRKNQLPAAVAAPKVAMPHVGPVSPHPQSRGESTMSKKILIASAAGTAFVAGLAAAPLATAAENPFALSGLKSGYQVADNHGAKTQAKTQEGKCGGKTEAEMKAKEGKCGNTAKMKDGKCGEGKCGASKSQGDASKAEQGKTTTERAKEEAAPKK
jgi:uncharacterized low-complexity protein